MNCKYTKYVLPAVIVLAVFPFFIFSLSFNNNDDQLMLLFSNVTGIKFQSCNLILIHHTLGQFINKLNRILPFVINAYSLLLYATLILNIILLLIVFTHYSRVRTIFESLLIAIFIFLGFFLYFYLELEFTSVSLLLALSTLYLILVEEKQKTILYSCLFAIALLWRKESGIVFFIFFLPLWAIPELNKKKLISSSLILLSIFVIIYLTEIFNPPYLQNTTFEKIRVLDLVCARPSYYYLSSQFIPSYVELLQHWFCADDLYLEGNLLAETSKMFKINLDISLITKNLVRLVLDERYGFLLYGLTYLVSSLCNKKYRRYLFYNLIILISFFIYLSIFYRTPKRLVLPILLFFAFIQFHIFITSTLKKSIRYSFYLLMATLCTYKTYKLVILSVQHKQEHIQFNKIRTAINSHPEYLFIANPQTIKLNYMNSLVSTDSTYNYNNLIIYGWINLSPDFKIYLKQYQLTNLTIDLLNRKDVFFINDDVSFENTYIKFMRDRYHLETEFVSIYLSPELRTKKLILKHAPSQL